MKIHSSIILLLVLLGCQSESAKETRPNILFILVDDLGKEWVNCYGAEDIQTPNIDQLAASGQKFHNVYSMPQCTPSRLTFLTGQYPFRHGWVNHWDVPRWGGGAHYDEQLNPSLGKEMVKAGYQTAIAGKWQIDDFRVEPDALTRNGFQEYCMWTGYETGIPASAERYQNPYIYTNSGSKTYANEFGPDVFQNFIIDFIKQPKEKPFFVYYPMVLPHTPFVDTPDEKGVDNLSRFKAMVRYVDKITGNIVKALETSNQRENTLIIWTTDNGSTQRITGTYQGQQVKGGKMTNMEAGINAPFIASWPKYIEPNTESNALIDFTDFYPTFLDLAGSTVKKKWTENGITHILDGHSFKFVLKEGAKKSNRDWILSMGGGNHAQLTEKGVENQYVFRDRMLRTERYKLHVNALGAAAEFYDLQSDPFEKNNLIWAKKSWSSQANQAFDRLVAVIPTFPKRDVDPKYRPNPAQDWDVEITAESEVWKK